jgi:putative CocE/NonD family hydrolase
VGMFGGSYAGGDQWQTAAMHPPHLTTIVPVASVRPGVDFPAQLNVANPYMLQWATYTNGHTLYESVFSDGTMWDNAAKRLYLAKAAFNQFDTYAGSTDTDFQTWLQHPDHDSYWEKYGLTRAQVAGVTIPTLVITGAKDGDQLGTLSYYADHITTTDKTALENYYLVMGPWDHPGTREPKAEFGGEHYGGASLVDVLRLHREWYDYTMKAGAKPGFLQDHVAYYVSGAGAECWKYAPSLAAASKKSLTFYLDASGGAAALYRSGVLATTQTGAVGGSFVADPNDLSGAEDSDGQPGSDLHGDGLIFHTAPFTEATEIDGKIDLRLWLKIDAPDTDLFYELHLLTPDGKHHFLDTSILRARYRNSREHPEAIQTNQPEEYRFSPYFWFATRAPKGSQLRLIVGYLNTPQSEKNYNSMKPVAEQTGADARIAHITLLQTKEHPSTLTLPLGDVSASCKASAEW